MRQLGDRATGVSRSTGHDITQVKARREICDMMRDYDVLINNAYVERSGDAVEDFQTALLIDVYREHRDLDKYVVNIGSAVTDYDLGENFKHLELYQTDKQNLKDWSVALTLRPTKMKIQYVSFGYVGTERIRNKYPDLVNCITPAEAAEFIIDTPVHGQPMNIINPDDTFSQTRTYDLRKSTD